MALDKLTTKLTNKADSWFVDNWRQAWKWFSVQLTLVVGVITTLAFTDRTTFDKLVDVIPERFRPFVTVFCVTIIPLYLRLKDQNKTKVTPSPSDENKSE